MPIRLAVVFDQHIQTGGGFHQSLNAILIVSSLPKSLVEPFFFTTIKENVDTLAGHNIKAALIRLTPLHKLLSLLRRCLFSLPLPQFFCKLLAHSPLELYLLERGIDLVYFLAPTYLALELDTINYIATLWDLCHLDLPEFPEVRSYRQFETRELCNRAILPRAIAIFVDSAFGKHNASHRYSLSEERIYVMPFQPALATHGFSDIRLREPISICDRYEVDVPYVFYPAQFWPHKNHVYILDGLKSLEELFGVRVGAIFAGSDKGNLSYVQSYARSLNLGDRVRFIGFVPSELLPDLYLQSLALVMPTYFGPTNLPPMEAFQLGVPVLYSNRCGLRDQVLDAGLLMDLSDPTSMATHLNDLIHQPQLRDRLLEAGRERYKQLSTFDYVGTLTGIIEDFFWKRHTWR
jgi:glycosyltransferase involved in cell wall biosynthesis